MFCVREELICGWALLFMKEFDERDYMVIEAEMYGSINIKEGNETDIDKAKNTFMQWIMSVYQGVEYDFLEEH